MGVSFPPAMPADAASIAAAYPWLASAPAAAQPSAAPAPAYGYDVYTPQPYPYAAQPAPYAPSPNGYDPATVSYQTASLQQELQSLESQIQSLMQQANSWFSQSGPAPAPVPIPGGRATSFNIASFNVLGNSHTTAGGEKPQYASGPARMHNAVQLIQQKQLDVVGFQELQPVQAAEFQQLAGRDFGLYPGNAHGKGASVDSIAWRKATWDLVGAQTFKVPYFDGHPVDMPIVRLRNKQTGQEAYFVNVHNPADTARFHHQQGYREQATQIEAATLARLKASGLPVFFTGDMNEHEPFFDRLTSQTPMVTANDAKTRAHGIDWITASPGVHFDHFVRDRGNVVQATTDHPVVSARARIG